MAPNDLKTAPLLALTGFAADQFANYIAGFGFESQPARTVQQQATGKETGADPPAIRIEDRDRPITANSETTTCGESPDKISALGNATERPEKTGDSSPQRGKRQRDNDDQTCRPQNQSGYQNDGS